MSEKIKNLYYELGYQVNDKGMKEADKKVNKLTQEWKGLGVETDKTGKKIDESGKKLKNAGEKGKQGFDLFNNSLTDSIFGGSKLGSTILGLGAKASAIGLLTIAASEFKDMMVEGVKATEKSDLILRSMLAREKKSAGALTSDELKVRADIGAPLGFKAEDVVMAEDKFSLAGYSEEKRLEYLPGALKAARAYGVDVVDVIDKATDLATPLGLDTKQKFEDFLGDVEVISSRTNTDAAQLNEALIRGGAAGIEFGDTREQAMAGLGVLADQGLKGSEGGTAMRNITLGLLGTGSKKQKALLKKAGVKEGMSTMQRAEKLDEYTKGMNVDKRARVLTSVFGKENIVSYQKYVAGLEKMKELEKEIINSGVEVLDFKNEEMLKGLAGQKAISEATKEAAAIGKTEFTEKAAIGYYKTKTELYKEGGSLIGGILSKQNEIQRQKEIYEQQSYTPKIEINNNFNGGNMGLTREDTENLNLKIKEIVDGWFGNKMKSEMNRLR
ncbi:MAG: phage tail tape measure protein [Sarcina sp.]